MSTLTEIAVHNPVEDFLRMERIPSIWCPGCGIGTTVNSFVHALMRNHVDMKKLVVVSGIGCSGRVGGYIGTDHFHTTHGRAIPFATGLSLANPELNVVVYSGDGDLVSIGGNHLIHAARRNMNLLVICVNNMIYAMTGGQAAATTPPSSMSSTTPYGAFEPDINIPQLVDAAGRRPLDRIPRQTAGNLDGRSPQEERLPVHRGGHAVSDVVPAQEQHGRWPGRDEGLQGAEQDPQRRPDP
jgi:2-oxoglutarate/2-oxoacid ferredoxin oxidoreductase subunit beta